MFHAYDVTFSILKKISVMFRKFRTEQKFHAISSLKSKLLGNSEHMQTPEWQEFRFPVLWPMPILYKFQKTIEFRAS